VCVRFRAQDGRTALHKAAHYGHTEAARALLDGGAAVDAANKVCAPRLSRAVCMCVCVAYVSVCVCVCFGV